jgi:transposase
MTVWLQITTRRYRCDNQTCARQTFAEQHLQVVGRRKRRTKRLLQCISEIGLALGGAAGARLAAKLAMAVSGATILRQLNQLDVPVPASPRVIGIDDWALRKGRDYGTIIIDHETGKPIDLLPDRDSETVKEWLDTQPSIELVTRDRSGEYRDAITRALPAATQVADRWHLLKNLREAIERHVTKRRKALSQLVADLIEHTETEPTRVKTTEKRRRYAPGPEREALHTARTNAREALYKAVKERRAQGAYTTDIAREFNLSRQTISRWINSESLPPDTRGRFKRKCLIDDYTSYLEQRLAQGCTNKSQLWREICAQGFTGSRSLVGKWIRQHIISQNNSSDTTAPTTKAFALPCASELSWLLIRPKDDLEEEEKNLLELLRQDDQIAELRELAHQFRQMVRDRLSDQWDAWVEKVNHSSVQELKNFVIGLQRDLQAVVEALRQPYSNGRTEGHVNRLKLIKRQMYGRANFDLLRLRVLLAT